MIQTLEATSKGKAPSNGIEIYYEAFGNPDDTAILLIMGLDAQSILFYEDFISPLVSAGFYVIRFDNRDIGLSTWMNERWHRRNPYTIEDMAKDSVGLLDYLKIDKANILGVSMGGMIAQRIAISHSERVLSLTSIMSSGFVFDPKAVPFKHKGLAYLAPFVLKRFYIKNKVTEPVISVNSYILTYKNLAGDKSRFNKEHLHAIFTEGIEKRKGQNPRARYQQLCAIAASGSRLKELSTIKVPTLIIHGTADPLVPPIHAKIYAPLIPNARMVWIEGMGHELARYALPEIFGELFKTLVKN